MAAQASGNLHLGPRELFAGLTAALCEAVAACVAANRRAGDGSALRDHIDQLCRQTGKSPEELGLAPEEAQEPEVPFAGEHLWAWFWEVSEARASNGFCLLPLSWVDIEAWARLTATPLSPYEALTLRRMDAAYLSAHAQATKKDKERL